MFWSKDKKTKKIQNRDKRQKQVSVGTPPKMGTNGQRSRASLEAEALANMRAARENIGDETLQRIAQSIQKKQNSPAEKARELIRKSEPDSVLYEMRHLIDN